MYSDNKDLEDMFYINQGYTNEHIDERNFCQSFGIHFACYLRFFFSTTRMKVYIWKCFYMYLEETAKFPE